MPCPVDRTTTRRRLCAGIAGLAVFTLGIPAARAQQPGRVFPATALRGDIQFGEAPEILLNGRPTRLSPGSRIRDTGNLVVTPAPLMGRRAVVHYTLDDLGNVRDVWLLTTDEVARRWPRTPAEAERLVFDPVAQTWSRP